MSDQVVRIYATADLHGSLPDPRQLPECDLFLIGGDITPVHNHHPVYQIEWLGSTFKTWLEIALEERVGEVIAIAGNHDFAFQTIPHRIPELPWTYLQDQMVERQGLKIYGTPWTPRFGRWAFMGEELVPDPEVDLESIFAEIPEGIDILLSHGPPADYGDRNYCGDYVGSHALKQRISVVRPQHLVCGHIHEGYGLYRYSAPPTRMVTTTIWNVSQMNFNYQPINPPVQIAL